MVVGVDSVVDALLIVDDTRGSMRDVYSEGESSRGVIVGRGVRAAPDLPRP